MIKKRFLQEIMKKKKKMILTNKNKCVQINSRYTSCKKKEKKIVIKKIVIVEKDCDNEKRLW